LLNILYICIKINDHNLTFQEKGQFLLAESKMAKVAENGFHNIGPRFYVASPTGFEIKFFEVYSKNVESGTLSMLT
jgi:hypothetical protein